MFGPLKAVVFDLDGTLVNSMGGVMEGFRIAVAKKTGAPIDEMLFQSLLGADPLKIFKGLFPQREPAWAEELYEQWLEIEKENAKTWHQKFEGSQELLHGLRNEKIPFGLFTGRDQKSATIILESLNWWNEFFSNENSVFGDQLENPKPSGDGLRLLMDKFSWEPQHTLYVGDHPKDIQAGRDAGCRTAAVVWNFNEEEGITPRMRFRNAWSKWDSLENPDLRLDHPLSLLNYFTQSPKLR
jgi:phosphoglycolate phosphatase-like HAD superfamily hydrolase